VVDRTPRFSVDERRRSAHPALRAVCANPAPFNWYSLAAAVISASDVGSSRATE